MYVSLFVLVSRHGECGWWLLVATCMCACMQISFCLRNHEYSTPPATLQDLPQHAVTESVEKLAEGFNEIKVPVATAQQVNENYNLLGLPVPMHEALAGSRTRLCGMHDVGVDTLMHDVSHAQGSVVTGANYKALSRAVRIPCIVCLSCVLVLLCGFSRWLLQICSASLPQLQCT